MRKANSVKKTSPFIFFAFIAIAFCNYSSAQTITKADRKQLEFKEDSLKDRASYMVLDTIAAGRLLAYKDFVPVLIRALKVKNSFYYPFDSVQGISKLYAPDSSFRIFTWYIEIDDYTGWQRGFIQQRTSDGSLKGNWLFDNSEYAEYPEKMVCRDSTWIGAVYYDIIKTEYQGKNFYTLFGIDRYAIRSDRKWIEVLTFDDKKQPVFGGQYFSFQEDSIKKTTQSRFGIEFKEEARTLVDYIPDLKMILVDHLISETDEPDNFSTYVPDGDYEGFKWQNGKWVHIDKVFNLKLEDGQAPIGDPLLDIKGKKDENKLQQKSDSNKVKKPGGNN